jgi:hypothetical protein
LFFYGFFLAVFYSGPSWRLPDGPIVGLNYKGNLSVYMGNGDGEMISTGVGIEKIRGKMEKK